MQTTQRSMPHPPETEAQIIQVPQILIQDYEPLIMKSIAMVDGSQGKVNYPIFIFAMTSNPLWSSEDTGLSINLFRLRPEAQNPGLFKGRWNRTLITPRFTRLTVKRVGLIGKLETTA